MKKDGIALIFDSGKGAKTLVLVLLLVSLIRSQPPPGFHVNQIIFQFNNSFEQPNINKYKSLINIKEGQPFSRKKIRESLENLFKTGSFSHIEARIQKLSDRKVDIYFITRNKYFIKSISIIQSITQKKKGIKKAIYSLNENRYLEESRIPLAIQELKDFLRSRGYNHPEIQYRVKKNPRNLTAALKFIILSNKLTRINRLTLTVDNPDQCPEFIGHFNTKHYIPHKFQKSLEKIRSKLKKLRYYFPEIRVQETYLNEQHSQVDLDITLNLGYKHIFIFQGMKPKKDLISSIWEEKVYEKWALNASENRILNHLKNKGYLDARVSSDIRINDFTKFITFTVEKNKKYSLGRIDFKGNTAFSKDRLKKVMKTDDLIYDRIFELRSDSISLDLEILKLLYYFNGYPLSKITMEPEFRGRKADLNFIIQEGQKFRVDSILFEGNQTFTAKRLLGVISSRENQAFVQQNLNRDIEKLRDFFLENGFDDVRIDLDISAGHNKSILVKINEGKPYRMWNLMIIGASKSQSQLLRKLFPLKKNASYNQNQINQFKTQVENTSIFSEVNIIKLKKDPNLMDVLIMVIPDNSRYYGFGIGWEDRKNFRGSLEYQAPNIFKSYSTLSAILQIGFSEKRAVLSYDTPYFLRSSLSSSFKIWDEDEIYPSYKFNRYGLGESIIKKISPNSFIMASLNWYRTKLTELLVSEQGIDQLDVPFDTTAISLFYVMEKRDDPFNPLTGDFFSSNLKIGLPLFEKDYSFFKFFWSYQKNIRLSKRSNISFSVRNGFSAGDMSITERFFAGGVHSFRGTRNDHLGPLDPETDKPRGGNALLLFNLEATFPIIAIPIEDLYYSVFVDFGNVFDSTRDLSLNNLEKAVGFGLKYKTPFGPLRVDLAWNLNPDVGDRFLVQIGIGNVF
ncbi:MAG: BamA/TamA family outer membrane protein [Candidatus Aminicenantes bacterium]|nr:BamA/TamA family outer membrane protein [Candidatus Aminicenantes bacterium]